MLLYDLYKELLDKQIIKKIYVSESCIWKAEDNLDMEVQTTLSNIYIEGISRNSYKVGKNDVFVCIKGASFDGHRVADTLDVAVVLYLWLDIFCYASIIRTYC